MDLRAALAAFTAASVAVFCFGMLAQAQSVLQSGPAAPGHAPMYGTGSGQGFAAILDSGFASGLSTTGTPTGTGLSELLQFNPLGNNGSGPLGTHSCFVSNPAGATVKGVTSPSGYYALCLDADTGANGVISFNAYGGAPTIPLKCNINGTYEPCFSSSPNHIDLLSTGTDHALTVTEIMSGVNNVFLGPPLFASGQVLGDFAGAYIQATNTALAAYDVPLGAAFVTPFWVDFTVAGPTVTGNQTSTLFTMSVNQPGKPHQNQSGGQRWYSALYTDTWMYVNDGGTPSAAQGNLQGGVFTVNALNGSTYLNDIEGIEVNAGCYTGCSTLFKEGVVITGIIGDAVHATELEGLLVLSTQNAGFGWNVGILLTDVHGGNPLSTGGCVMCAIFHGGPYTIANGIDLSAYTITNNLLASRTFQISGAGMINIATLDPTIEMRDTSTGITVGGLIRFTCSSGNCAWQQNTAVAGDFSTFNMPFGWNSGGAASVGESLFVDGVLEVKAATPSLEMFDTAQPITTGGLIRLIGNTGAWAFQVNTAVGGDFTGTVLQPLSWDINGTVHIPQIVTSPGGKNMLCIDNATKAIYQGTTTTC